jgi:hypothetical protein
MLIVERTSEVKTCFHFRESDDNKAVLYTDACFGYNSLYFSQWMIERLDKEAERLGVTRQSVIKFVVADHLEKVSHN